MKKFLSKKQDDKDDSVSSKNIAVPDDEDSDKELFFEREDELADDFSVTSTHDKPNSTKFGTYVLDHWHLRQACLKHDSSIAAWMLSPCPEIQHQVKSAFAQIIRNRAKIFLLSCLFQKHLEKRRRMLSLQR